MQIPLSNRKKALVLIDIQSAFITPRNRYILKNVTRLIQNIPYDAYVTALFYAERNSIWDKQLNWTCPKKKDFQVAPEVSEALKNKSVIPIEKTTKSIWKGTPRLHTLLQQKKITEVHLVGYDTNDCVLASAYEAFDLGYFTYVLEECCESSSSKKLHDCATTVLREVNLSNHAIVEKIPHKTIKIQ